MSGLMVMVPPPDAEVVTAGTSCSPLKVTLIWSARARPEYAASATTAAAMMPGNPGRPLDFNAFMDDPLCRGSTASMQIKRKRSALHAERTAEVVYLFPAGASPAARRFGRGRCPRRPDAR
jgi:hypothetical protein